MGAKRVAYVGDNILEHIWEPIREPVWEPRTGVHVGAARREEALCRDDLPKKQRQHDG